MIASGSHVLFGTLVLTRPLSEALAAWTAAHPAQDELDARDRAWWVEGMMRVVRNELMFYDEARSSYATVAVLRTLVDAVAAIATSGTVELQHLDNGVHVVRWTVRDGVVTCATEERQRAVSPKLGAAERAYFERKGKEIAARYENQSPDEKLRELIARTRDARGINLIGGTSAQREQLALAIHREHRPGMPLGRDLATLDGLFVADLAQLSATEQAELLEGVREAAASHVYLGMGDDPAGAIMEGKLREDLFYRITAWPTWRL